MATAKGMSILPDSVDVCYESKGKAAAHLHTFPLAEVMKPNSSIALTFNAQVQRVKLFILIEQLGFFIIFTCMILMRFGL